MSNAISGPVSFGLIPRDHWFQPDWIDEEKAAAGRAQMAADGVVYGGEYSMSTCPRRYISADMAVSQGAYRKRKQCYLQVFKQLTSQHRYRNMCRFNSGVRLPPSVIHDIRSAVPLTTDRIWQFFYRHPLVSKVKWYWRVE